jgi:hypothetical protein
MRLSFAHLSSISLSISLSLSLSLSLFHSNGSVLEEAARASGRSGSVVAGDNEELLVAAQDSANGDAAQPSACFASFKTPRMFDAAAVDVTFDWRLFAKEFCYNFFWPFSGPFARLIEGPAYYANHRFHTISNLAMIVTVWAVNVICVVRPALFNAPNGLTVIEIFMMNLLCAVHRAMTAVKYAYMPAALVRELHEREFSFDELDSMQLITGWQQLTAENCEAELAQTAASLGFKLSETRFHVSHSIEELRDFLGRNDYPDMPSPSFVGLRQICLRAMLGKLTFHVYQASQPAAWSMLLLVLYSLVQAVFPVLIRSIQVSGRLDIFSFDMVIGWGFAQPSFSKLDSNLASSVIIISCFVRFVYSSIILLFVNVGILDLKRRARMLVALQRLVDPTPMPLHRLDCTLHAAIPENMLFLDLSVSQNIPHWWVARKIVSSFGLRFRRRIEAYMLMFSLMLVTLVLIMLAELLRGRGSSTESINTMCLVLVNFPAFVICLILMVHMNG